MRIDAINSSESVVGVTLSFCHVVNPYFCCVAGQGYSSEALRTELLDTRLPTRVS